MRTKDQMKQYYFSLLNKIINLIFFRSTIISLTIFCVSFYSKLKHKIKCNYHNFILFLKAKTKSVDKLGAVF